MSVITIRFLEDTKQIEISKGDDTGPTYAKFQELYADAADRMRFIRRVADLMNDKANPSVLSALANLGHQAAIDIFGDDWSKVRDQLRTHPGVDIQVVDELFVWRVPWELLSYEGDGRLEDFVGYNRNIYRVLPRCQIITRPDRLSSIDFIPYSKIEETETEARNIGRVRSYGIECRKYEVGHPSKREDALEKLLAVIKSADVVHFAGVIVPLQHAKQSWMLVGDDLYLSEGDLRVPPDQTRKPLIIFNLRDNYCRDPEQLWDYIKLFLNRRAIGVIASEFPIPSQLAACFAAHFYRNLMQNGESLGRILTETKSTLLREQGNPFAMFYAPYFDPNTRLEMREETPVPPIDPDNPPISVIRELLIKAFTPSDLLTFCEDDPSFRPLTSKFGPKYNLEDMVQEVLEFCKTKLLWVELLAKVKEKNPNQYARFAPRLADYYRQSSHSSNSRKPPAVEQYTDFALHIGPDGHARADSDEGQRSATISLDIPEEVKLTVDLIELDHTNADLLKKFGKLLYQIIFPATIDRHFNQTEAVARSKDSKVRIRLTIEPDALAQLPWEFLYREERGYFLATNPDTVLSHYLDLPLPPGYVRQGEGPLHMLTIISNPKDQPQLDVERWDQIVRQALSKPLGEGQLTLQTVGQATFENIEAALLDHPPDIVQFVGHGVYQRDKGYLALVGENGNTCIVDDKQFAQIFAGVQDRLGLVCLATCESAKSDSPQSFLGIAPQIVQRGVPAVVAMRYPVRVSTAEIFLESFYKAVAARKPVDWAVQWARNAISIQVGLNNRDFATPVLFMRAKDGNIF